MLCRKNILCSIWMHHLSVKKPMTNGLGRNWELVLPRGERIIGPRQAGDGLKDQVAIKRAVFQTTVNLDSLVSGPGTRD